MPWWKWLLEPFRRLWIASRAFVWTLRYGRDLPDPGVRPPVPLGKARARVVRVWWRMTDGRKALVFEGIDKGRARRRFEEGVVRPEVLAGRFIDGPHLRGAFGDWR